MLFHSQSHLRGKYQAKLGQCTETWIEAILSLGSSDILINTYIACNPVTRTQVFHGYESMTVQLTNERREFIEIVLYI